MATTDRCIGRARHWRIAFGTVGLRTPVCVYCGSPNPRPLSNEEWTELLDWVEYRRSLGQLSPGRHVEAAIRARLEGS